MQIDEFSSLFPYLKVLESDAPVEQANGIMELIIEAPTRVGWGVSTHQDAFQSGRESAQIAQTQLPEGKNDLFLVFGPDTLQYKDFIEGVRLVTGEKDLLGLPTSYIFTNENVLKNSGLVLALRAPSMKLSLACSEMAPSEFLAGSTSLFSQFRQQRGNNRLKFSHHGVVAFTMCALPPDQKHALQFASNAGLESWIGGFSLTSERKNPMICSNKTISQGMIALECLSNETWGIASVDIHEFPSKDTVILEAARAAIRDAAHQMGNRRPAFALLQFNFPQDRFPIDTIRDSVRKASTIVSQLPIFGFFSETPFVRSWNNTLVMQQESVSCLLVPQ